MPSLLQDLQIVEKVGITIASDVEAFAAGSPLSIPPIQLSKSATNVTELVLGVQKVSIENPFTIGSITGFLGELMLDIVSGQAISLPPFTEKLGNTIIQISASVQRVSLTAAPSTPAALPAAAAA